MQIEFKASGLLALLTPRLAGALAHIAPVSPPMYGVLI
jgi:hypothetical protein